MIIHNKRLAQLIRAHYTAQQIAEIESCLQQKGTLDFPALANGLFPAAVFDDSKKYTGYSYVWVRDNIHVANAHYVVGNAPVASRTVSTLMEYFSRHQNRFLDIITGSADPADPMNRPHIRFNGETLEEVKEKWAHAQNDALGYFLWLFSKLANDKKLSPSHDQLNVLSLFPRYFQAIAYWQDEDSGHWEETRKMSASSIGVVIAGLREYKRLIAGLGKNEISDGKSNLEFIESLINHGLNALRSILPAECVQPDPAKRRLYDAALLFLIYPIGVVGEDMAGKILENTILHLQGDYGIRRYPLDSYWAPDYKRKLDPTKRTVDFSDNLSSRDRLLPSAGQEAQWCIFDSIVSCIYGTRFRISGKEDDLVKQTEYLNRSLGQITAEEEQEVPRFRCPELYYLENGRYVPNDHVPLLWTQANLMLSLWAMKESCILAAQDEYKVS